MEKFPLLVDTDIFIHYFDRHHYRLCLEGESWQIYYSVVTKKEVLAKRGLSDRERRTILFVLRGCRQIGVTCAVAQRYAELRRRYPTLEREDALIAASALVRRIPLLTGNVRHFRVVERLELLSPQPLLS